MLIARVNKVIASALAIGLATLIAPAFSANLFGSKCTKLGTTKTVSNIKYTCIKQGSKLIWNKGVAIKKPTVKPTPASTPAPLPSPSISPTPSPTPTATTSPTPSPTPTPTASKFVPPSMPTSFKDVQDHINGISYWAWKKSNEKVATSKPNLGKIKIIIGPNTVPDNQQPLVALDLVSRLFSNFKQPTELLVVYASEKDIDWGQSQIDALCGPNDCGYNVQGEAKKACNVPVTPCWGGLAVANNRTGVPMIYQTASDWGKKDLNHTQGTLEAHEFFHTIQDLNVSPQGWGVVPRWFVEGSATWVQAAAIFHGDYESYLSESKRTTREYFRNGPVNEEWLIKFLNPNPVTDWSYWESYSQDRLYDTGALATEIMASIGGPDAVLNLLNRVGQGQSFTDAFKSEFGISWSEGVSILARVILAQK